jgi:hypothetical protein
LCWGFPAYLSLLTDLSVLTVATRNKYSVADDDQVNASVAKKWTDELFAMMEEMVPGVTKF